MFQPCRFVTRFMLALSPFLFSGCAVYMAAKGTPGPYESGPFAGQDRDAVIADLGPPKESIDSNGRRFEVYEYNAGNEASPWRAVVHGVLDVCSLGLWEIIGTPIEMAQGKKVRVAIEYDDSGRVSQVLSGRGDQTASGIATAGAETETHVR